MRPARCLTTPEQRRAASLLLLGARQHKGAAAPLLRGVEGNGRGERERRWQREELQLLVGPRRRRSRKAGARKATLRPCLGSGGTRGREAVVAGLVLAWAPPPLP